LSPEPPAKLAIETKDLVPAVRQIFIRRFGQDRIRGGNEFTSVAISVIRLA
jgi:hypothetical protein